MSRLIPHSLQSRLVSAFAVDKLSSTNEDTHLHIVKQIIFVRSVHASATALNTIGLTPHIRVLIRTKETFFLRVLSRFQLKYTDSTMGLPQGMIHYKKSASVTTHTHTHTHTHTLATHTHTNTIEPSILVKLIIAQQICCLLAFGVQTTHERFVEAGSLYDGNGTLPTCAFITIDPVFCKGGDRCACTWLKEVEAHRGHWSPARVSRANTAFHGKARADCFTILIARFGSVFL
jgi:hypothetical protein